MEKKRYKIGTYSKGVLKGIQTVVGETIEQKVERMMHNKEGIESTGEVIFQTRGEGVNPMYDPRTDKMEIAVEAMDKVTANFVLKRANMELVKTDTDIAKSESAEGTQEVK